VRRTYLLIGGATLALAACNSAKKTSTNDDLRKDLELASSSDGISVGTTNTQGTQIVSAIERTAPAPKAPAPAAKAHRYHKAPTRTPAPVQTEAPASMTEPAPTPVSPEPVATEPAPPVSPRPTPQTVSYPGGNTGSVSRGPSTGEVIGTILGAVLRGAVIGGGGMDTCDPRTDGRRGRRNGGSIQINQRIPGRIGGIPVGW